MIKKSAYIGMFILFLITTISCEKDFQDIASSVINNTKFETKEIVLDVEISPVNIDAVRADNIALGNLGEYLLGVYKKGKGNDKTVAASMVSQLILPSATSLKIVTKTLKTGEKVKSTLDEIILKIPLKATSKGKTTVTIKDPATGNDKKLTVPKFKIDSLLGNPDDNFTLNVFRGETFLNNLDPTNPAKSNIYNSNASYLRGTTLNSLTDFNFKNADKDTLYVLERTLSTGTTYKDTIKVANGTAVKANPFKVIKLDLNALKTVFFDTYTNGDLVYKKTEFSSQNELNKYIKNIIIEALGTKGSMLPLDFSNLALVPSIDVLYTNTILDSNDKVVDTIAKTHSFKFGGIKNSMYKTANATNTPVNSFIVQGTSGSMANIKILNKDVDNNGISDLEDLRKLNILVNDASLIFDINTNLGVSDTTNVPKKLFLYKNGLTTQGKPNPSIINDLVVEGAVVFGGGLTLADKKPKNYTFRITQYIAKLLSGKVNENPVLGLKVYNTSDLPTNASDTTIKTYNWNPRSVLLLDNSAANGDKRARLKISYSKKK